MNEIVDHERSDLFTNTECDIIYEGLRELWNLQKGGKKYLEKIEGLMDEFDRE